MNLDRRRFLHYATFSGAAAAFASTLLADCDPVTSAASEGPYWRENAPFTDDIRRKGGEEVVVRGVVRSVRECRPIAGAILDIWQADHTGRYDVDYRAGETFGRCRMRTGEGGSYKLLTTLPSPYGFGGSMRPAHIHFIVSADGHRRLTTQLYFSGDRYLTRDPIRAVHADLVKPLQRRGSSNTKECVFDIYVA